LPVIRFWGILFINKTRRNRVRVKRSILTPIRRMLEFLLPKEKRFLNMLAAQADLLLDATEQYHEFTVRYNKLSEKQRVARLARIKEIERKGDVAMRELIDDMHETFITPLDREDILNISHRLEQTLDMTYGATRMPVMYRIKKMPKEVVFFAKMLHNSAHIIRDCMHHLKNYEEAKKSVGALSRIEADSDRLYYESMSTLFEKGHSPEEIIKLKDLYALLEDTIDSCKKVGRMIERTVLKHA